MINLRDIEIAPRSLGQRMLLVDIAPAYEYKDGRRTDKLVGYRYIVALPEHGLEKISVRIEDTSPPMEKPDGYAEVEFTGLKVGLYESQGHVQITAKATGIHLVNPAK